MASKNFTESYLLGEMIAQRLERAGFEVDRRFGLGGNVDLLRGFGSGEMTFTSNTAERWNKRFSNLGNAPRLRA
ncbi:MAG: hypothetical protein CM1200mP9_08890 [Gammaproteobacteria bacterium]|nr:MAG: hypothetical protein CM1200mP9_08890 [Gammaproteobacteria bacterium]